MPRHERWRRTRGIIVDYALIGLGAALVGAAADMFFVPNRLVSGGLVLVRRRRTSSGEVPA